MSIHVMAASNVVKESQGFLWLGAFGAWVMKWPSFLVTYTL